MMDIVEYIKVMCSFVQANNCYYLHLKINLKSFYNYQFCD